MLILKLKGGHEANHKDLAPAPRDATPHTLYLLYFEINFTKFNTSYTRNFNPKISIKKTTLNLD